MSVSMPVSPGELPDPDSSPPAPPEQSDLHLSYVLPIRDPERGHLFDLATYVRGLAPYLDVVVVDGSTSEEVAIHRELFGDRVRVVEPELTTANGKVGGVITGLRHARHERVVIADDDVRYTIDQLEVAGQLLDDADVVRPQNYFDPAPWHGHVDAARTVLNRAIGGDWPGTLVVRRDVLLRSGGYRGDVLFENLELVRTVRAVGGRERLALDLLVVRRPPSTSHFCRQQVRQAYDEFARPLRLFLWLALAPAVVVLVAREAWVVLAVLASVCVALSEFGRRRASGRRVFPVTATLISPLWCIWRSLMSYVAIGSWLCGGARYRGVRLRAAATSRRTLRRQLWRMPVSGRTRPGEAGRPLRPVGLPVRGGRP